MSIQEEQKYHGKIVSQKEEITSRDVADYLQKHPDFLKSNVNILTQMEIPHDCGGAISLIEYQVIALREKNKSLKGKLLELMQVARENDQLTERMMNLTLALMGAGSLEKILAVLDKKLASDFEADAITIRLFDKDNILFSKNKELDSMQDKVIQMDDPALAPFESFFHSGRPLCGRLKSEQLQYLFSAEIAKEINSAVLIPLGNHSELGMV
ncbi:MAG: DUF484 family protein, partial [Gammaproteobacteria bacterium]|nr:DUF484 family protein [Gammaproteobacteria bacterium]